MTFCIFENILSNNLIDSILKQITQPKLVDSKLSDTINYKQKIRYDVFINNKDLLSQIDNSVYEKTYESIISKLGINIKYREEWKIGKYDAERGGFYNIHKDCSGNSSHRKVSCILALSDPNDYNGSEIFFQMDNNKIKLKKNSIIFFKSDTLHSVTKIINGNNIMLIGYMFDTIPYNLHESIIKNKYTPLLKSDLLDKYYQINNYVVDKDNSTYYNNILWKDTDDYYRENNNSKILLLIFSGIGTKTSKATFILRDFLLNYKDIDKLFIRDLKDNYYVNGFKNNTKTLKESLDFIKGLINFKKYERIVAIGSSAGGFGAILFSEFLKLDKVVVFSPQTVLNEVKEKVIKDTYNCPNKCKWLTNLKKYKDNQFYHNCLDLSNFKPYKTTIDIHYSKFSNSGADLKHAKYIECNNCNLIEYSSDKHKLIWELRDNGSLKIILNDLLYNYYV